MAGLEPLLGPDLRVVFCGTAVAERSASLGHYYAGPGNEFWTLLHDAGFTSARLGPADDGRLAEFGLGLTDLARDIIQSHDRGLRSSYDVPRLWDSMTMFRPRFIAFTSLEAGRAVARGLGQSKPDLGLQSWGVAETRAFLLPSPSGANRRHDYSGRSTRLEWWAELSALAK
jgi:TDG/mug DNA glycosylase family protein